MKKSHAIKIITKTVFAGTAAIALCSVAFTEFNNKIFASEMNKQILEPTVYNIKTTIINPSEDYVKEDYEVIVNKLNTTKDKSAISAEAAAELGAKYLWNMCKVNLKGKVVIMSYNISPITSETRWIGEIYEKSDQTAKSAYLEQPDYSFMINAITGEMQSIQRKYTPVENSEPTPFNEEKANEHYKDNCSEYIKLAINFTEESYGVKVVSSDFNGVSALLAKVDSKTRKAHPENMMATRLYINIIVTDTEGEKYEVTITEDTKELQSITDIEPDGGSDYLG